MGQKQSQLKADRPPAYQPADFTSSNILSLKRYEVLKQLGEGSYGSVRMIRERAANQLYALKYIDKRHSAHVLQTILQERNMLGRVRHPFISNLHYAFQDDRFFFLVLDLGDSGDLRRHLTRFTFSEQTVRFWIAELACAVEYLHRNYIVHRDIKPENILLSSSGHVKLADFNVAIKISVSQPLIKGVSGTFNYLAPEMHQDGPYTKQVDWWALGVVFFECIYSHAPFFYVKNKAKILDTMISPGLVFPDTNPKVSEVCITAIKLFLQLYPPERVTSTIQIFNIEFFKGMERKALEAGMLPIHQGDEVSDQIHKPIYQPSNLRVLKYINSEMRISRETLEEEFRIWSKRRQKDEVRRRKQQAAVVKVPVKQDHREASVQRKFRETCQPNSSGNPEQQIIKVISKQSTPQEKQNRQEQYKVKSGEAKSSGNCLLHPLSTLRKKLGAGFKDKNPAVQKAPVVWKKPSVQENKPTPANKKLIKKRAAALKAKLEIQQNFESFNFQYQNHEALMTSCRGLSTGSSIEKLMTKSAATGSNTDFKHPQTPTSNFSTHKMSKTTSLDKSHADEKEVEAEAGATTRGDGQITQDMTLGLSCTEKEPPSASFPTSQQPTEIKSKEDQTEDCDANSKSASYVSLAGNLTRKQTLVDVDTGLPRGVICLGSHGRKRVEASQLKQAV